MTATTSAISFLPSLVRQPMTIAVLASLGLHAIFAANLENIRLYPDTVKLPPSVEMVELSPNQIDQVFPAPPPSQLSLNPFAASPSLPIWGSSPTPSQFPPSAQQLPVFPSTSSQPRSNPFAVSPSRPQPRFNNPSSRSNNTFLPPIPNTSSPPRQSSPTPPIEFYQTQPGQPSFPRNRNEEELGRMQNNPRFSHLSPEEQRLLEQQFSMLPPPPLRPRFPENDPNYSQPPQMPRDSGESGEPAQEFTPDTAPQPQEGGSLLAQLQEDNRRRADALSSSSSSVNEAPNEAPPAQPTGEVSDDQYAMLEGGGAYVEWVLSLQENYPDLNTSQPRTISALYPAEACDQNLSGQALVGIVIGAGGGIMSGPRLLMGSGYGVLDNAAVAAIRDVNFEGQGRPIAYQYAFSFDSENCQSVAPAPVAPAAPPESPSENTQEPEIQPEIEPELNPELNLESMEESPGDLESETEPEPTHSGSILQQLESSLQNPSSEFTDESLPSETDTMEEAEIPYSDLDKEQFSDEKIDN